MYVLAVIIFVIVRIVVNEFISINIVIVINKMNNYY